ncbi:MAG: KAP family NTPase [Pseudomonadota bacterium]|nr:KAP family NTPase [Pseudomonadota bacterium]
MADTGLGALGAIVPGSRLAEPNAVPARPPASRIVEVEAASSRAIFAADLPDGPDALGLDAPLGLLAGLAAHARIETPLTIGLFGPSGSGKSFALTKLIRSIEVFSARAATPASPYIGEIVALRVDAAHIEGHPATALAGALHASLAGAFPALAAEAARAARDPQAAASEALERLDVSRRKFEAEKRALDDSSARRARLAESILYQTPGSQVDTYTSANKARIKGLLSKLGSPSDPLVAYKDMAGTIASTHGAARAGFVLRAFFAFKGQTKLIATAILLLLSGAGLGFAIDEQTAWLGWLRANESSVSIANWLEDHMELLASLRGIIFLGAAIALGVNVWRASRLLQLVFRGAALLQADLAVARRETDGLFAHQARRVAALAAEVNILSRRAAEAERRAGDAHPVSSALAGPSPFAIDTATQQAQAFAAAVGAMIARPRETSPGTSAGGAPGRIVVALDHLDAVPASRGREILVYARSLFNHGFVMLIAADPARFAGAVGETAASLDKWIQVPFQIGEIASRANYATLVRAVLGGQGALEPRVRNAETSALPALDQPLSAAETQLLADLAPLAGSSARALKRFVNLYRLVRAQDQDHKGALAFMLALDAGGTPSEIAAVKDTLSNSEPDVELDLHQCGARLVEALAAVRAQGEVSVAAVRHAAATARMFSFNS